MLSGCNSDFFDSVTNWLNRVMNKHDLLNQTYELLSRLNIVTSENQFSVKWLGKTEGYIRSMRAKGSEPSKEALAICALRLQAATADLYPYLDPEDHGQFLRLAYQIRDEVLGGVDITIVEG